MIQLHITWCSGKILGYRLTGHSGTARHGQDIVCAGVSSLAQTALLGIGEHLHREVEYKVASGDFYMKLKGEPDNLTEAILQTMLLGMKEIAKLHPKALQIKDEQEVE